MPQFPPQNVQIKYIKQLGTMPHMQQVLDDIMIWGFTGGERGLWRKATDPQAPPILMTLWGVIGSDTSAETLSKLWSSPELLVPSKMRLWARCVSPLRAQVQMLSP